MPRRPPDRLQLEAMARAELNSAAAWPLRRRLITYGSMAIVGLVILALAGWLFSRDSGSIGVWLWLAGGAVIWLATMTLNIVNPGQFARVAARSITVREEDLGRNRGWGTPDIRSKQDDE